MAIEPTSLGCGVYLGGFHCCDPERFENIIHIFRSQNVPDYTCPTIAERREHGLKVEWREGEPFSAMRPGLDAVSAYAARPGDLLIHCYAGICRSAHLALVALIVRGVEPMEAMKRLYSGCWADPLHRRVPELFDYNLAELFRRFQKQIEVPDAAHEQS